MSMKWVYRWNTMISAKPVRKGVFRRKEGGFVVRGRTIDPRTGKKKEVRAVLPDVTCPDEARAELKRRLRLVEEGTTILQPTERPRFLAYAVSLLERKIKFGEVRSAKSREKWGDVIELHLGPAFGDFFIDRIVRADIEAWKLKMAEKVNQKQLAPTTVNGWLSILRVIINSAVAEFELERNPVALVKDLDTSTHHTYTDEEPNSLTVPEVAQFLAVTREFYPQHFAMVVLGLATGLRPSSLRPLRRAGETPDVLWDAGVLLVRRSQTRGEEVMERTKTAKNQRITLPTEIVEILRWHADRLPAGPMRDSELLFPSETGGFRSTSCLDKPFAEVTTTIKLKKHITPRALRRTFQDLARAAKVKDVVTRSISGHATEAMQHHYSTVNADEMRNGLAKVISLAKVHEAWKAAA